MLKNSKKGFVLVETLIVTLFVVTLFLLVYRVTVPSIGEYEQLDYYDDIDSIYYANLWKKVLLRYGDMPKIDADLITAKANNKYYLDITSCTSGYYLNEDYCNTMHKMLFRKGLNSKEENFTILLTDYNIADFRNEVKDDPYFDSGNLTNFANYIDTVGNEESFYSKVVDSNFIGKYRLFLVRNIVYDDYQYNDGSETVLLNGSVSKRYTNIGIYAGGYDKYIAGDKIKFDPGDGEKYFYVLKTSLSTDPTIDVILDHNLDDDTLYNVVSDSKFPPQIALNKLNTLTSGWTNVSYLTNHKYSSPFGCSGTSCDYITNYGSYRARFLEEDDIQSLLGCGIGTENCFDPRTGFEFLYANYPNLSDDTLKSLNTNLDDNHSYWTAMSVKNDSFAWTITNKGITPKLITTTNIGIRPVITLYKNKDNFTKVAGE